MSCIYAGIGSIHDVKFNSKHLLFYKFKYKTTNRMEVKLLTYKGWITENWEKYNALISARGYNLHLRLVAYVV